MRKPSLVTFLISMMVLTLAGAGFAETVAEATMALSGTGSRVSETALGDLTADAVRAAGRAEIGMVPANMLKEVTISAGPVTDTALISVLAFPDDTVVVLTLRGSQIQQALEQSLELYPKGNSGFLQVSGLTVRFDPDKPRGSRVQSVQAGGESLNPTRSYQTAMPISLGRGSLGYFRIWGKDDLLRGTNIKISTALVNYARERGALSYSPGDRISAKTN